MKVPLLSQRNIPCMSVLKDKTLEVARKRSAGQTEILLKAEGIPPAFVSLQIYPNLGAAPVEMTLPFPCKRLLALDANGCTLDKNITLHDLLGSRAFYLVKWRSDTFFTGITFTFQKWVTGMA